jgi:hypothetical protein
MRRRNRQGALPALLRAVGVLTFVLSCTALLPGDIGRAARGGVLALLIAAPLGRVAWLAARWARRGDVRYMAVALGVMSIVGLSALVA